MKSSKTKTMMSIIYAIFLLLAVSATAQEDSTLPFIWQKEVGYASGLYFSPDSKYVMFYNDTCTHIYESANGKEVVKFNGESIARFTPDGLYLTTAVKNFLIRRHLNTWTIKDTIKFDFPITYAYEYSPDASKLAIADNDTFMCEQKHNFKIFVYNTKDWTVEYSKSFTDYLKIKRYFWGGGIDTAYRKFIQARHYTFSRDSKYLIFVKFVYDNTNRKKYLYTRGIFLRGLGNYVINLEQKLCFSLYENEIKYTIDYPDYLGMYQFSKKYDKLYCITTKSMYNPYGGDLVYNAHGFANIDYNPNSKDSADFFVNVIKYPSKAINDYNILENNPTLNYLEDENIILQDGYYYNKLGERKHRIFKIYDMYSYDIKTIFSNKKNNFTDNLLTFPLCKISKDKKYVASQDIYLTIYNSDLLFKSEVIENNSPFSAKYVSETNKIFLSGFDKNTYLSNYKILDINGREVFSNNNLNNFRNGESSYLLPLNSVPNGVYLINFQTNNNSFSIKFIIER